MESNEAWIAMFRRLPGNIQEALTLVTGTGAEIVVQKILKLEPDFIILRGRLSGTQENRVMVIPYHQLALITVMQFLKDPEVEAIFGKGAPPAVADLPIAPASNGEATVAKPAEPAAEPPPAAAPAKKQHVPSKSVLVAKLRERLKDK